MINFQQIFPDSDFTMIYVHTMIFMNIVQVLKISDYNTDQIMDASYL